MNGQFLTMLANAAAMYRDEGQRLIDVGTADRARAPMVLSVDLAQIGVDKQSLGGDMIRLATELDDLKARCERVADRLVEVSL